MILSLILFFILYIYILYLVRAKSNDFSREELFDQSLRKLFNQSLLEWSQQFLGLDNSSFLNFWMFFVEISLPSLKVFSLCYASGLSSSCIHKVHLLFLAFINSTGLCLKNKKKRVYVVIHLSNLLLKREKKLTMSILENKMTYVMSFS